MQDYFDAMAESCKTEINRMNNVDIPNERKRTPPNKEQMAYKKGELSGEWSQLHIIDCIARDLYQTHGIIPPSIHTELYYVQKMTDDLYRQKEYDLAALVPAAHRHHGDLRLFVHPLRGHQHSRFYSVRIRVFYRAATGLPMV